MQKNSFKRPTSLRPPKPIGAKGSFSPRKRFGQKPKTVYIGNLRYNVGEKELMTLFGHYGRVKHIKLIKKPGSEESKGIAFVEMLKSKDADKAISDLNGKQLGGRTLKVSEAIDNHKEEEEQKKRALSLKKKNLKQISQEEIILKKKARRRTGLQDLFDNTRK